MTRKAVFAVPGDLSAPTGGYVYDRRIIAELRALGWQVDVLDLGEGFPHAGKELQERAGALLARAPRDRAVIVDGLAFGVLPAASEALALSHRIVALVHHPLTLETGLVPDLRATLRESERRALAPVRRIITTSETTRSLLVSDFAVAADRVRVVRPGTDHVTTLSPRRSGGGVALLAVGSIVPRKGYDLLVAVLATLKDLSWRLTIVGDRTRDERTARAIEGQIRESGLGDRIEMTGAVSAQRIAECYARADVFVLPSRFEGYGMAFAEATAYGLPIVGTRAGAIAEAAPADASILVAPDDAEALAAALRRVIGDRDARDTLAHAARRAAKMLPMWSESGMLFAQAIEGLE